MRKRTTAALLFCIGLLGTAGDGIAQTTNEQETVRKARQSYYSLKAHGLAGFRCEVMVDWDSLFKALKADAVGREQVVPFMKKTHFALLVGPGGASTVSHQSDVAPPNEQVAERVRSITSGVEQILTGFMHTWSMFTTGPPLPEPTDKFNLQENGDGYRLTYNDGKTDILTLMNHDFAITAIQATTPEFEGTVRPRFSRKEGRFVLAGYDGVYKPMSGSPQQVAVKVEYQEAGRFLLPATVTANVDSIEFPLTFSDCQVRKR